LTAETVKNVTKIEAISVFITSKLTSDILSKMPKLKVIATRSTGFDHIDLKYCKKKGIEVVNVPFYGENTVAEHAMALLLTLTRKIIPSVQRTRAGGFSRDGLEGVDLSGKVIGVIGTGHIGRHLIKMARAFDLRVIAYDLFENHEMAVVLGYEYVKLGYLLTKSDFISMHVPNTKSTYHLIDSDAIKKMKDDVYLINTSRGQAIDSFALYDALVKGKFGGIGLDVCENEQLLEKPELAMKTVDADKMHRLLTIRAMLKFDRVILTPHNAYHSKEALKRIQITTADNINKFAIGDVKNSIIKK